MYRSAFLGCGPRARAHARAYQPVQRGEIVAICDRDEGLLGSFGEEFGIERRHTDLDAMLERERPDLLHIVISPILRGSGERIRYPLMRLALPTEIDTLPLSGLRSVDGWER